MIPPGGENRESARGSNVCKWFDRVCYEREREREGGRERERERERAKRRGVSRNLKVTVRAIDKKERETSVSSLLVVDPVFSTPRLRRRRVNVRSRGKKGEKRFPKRKKPRETGEKERT